MHLGKRPFILPILRSKFIGVAFGLWLAELEPGRSGACEGPGVRRYVPIFGPQISFFFLELSCSRGSRGNYVGRRVIWTLVLKTA